jgi:hypothetical protein
MTPEEMAVFVTRRRTRNLVLGGILIALALLFFGITIVRMV